MFKVPNFDRNSAHKDLFARLLDPQLICSGPTGHCFFTSQFQICPWDYFSVERKSTHSGDSATCSGYYNCKYIAIVLLLCQKKTKKKNVFVDFHDYQFSGPGWQFYFYVVAAVGQRSGGSTDQLGHCEFRMHHPR